VKAMASKITLEGLQALTEQIEKLGLNKKSIIRNGLQQGAEILRDDMVKRIKKSDKKHKHLRENIPITISTKNENYQATIGFEKSDNSDFFYAKFLEWGTPKMLARPFMQPAFNSKKKKAFDKLVKTVREALNE
jgi:HK97 gp10 family phage protein